MKLSILSIAAAVFQATSAAPGANSSVSVLQNPISVQKSTTPLSAKSETSFGKIITSAVGDTPTSYDGHHMSDAVEIDKHVTYDDATTNGHQTISSPWLNASSLTLDTTHDIAVHDTCANYAHVDALAIAIGVVLGDTNHGSSTAAADAKSSLVDGCNFLTAETNADMKTTFDNELFILLFAILGAGFYSYHNRPTPDFARDFIWTTQNLFSSSFILGTTIFFLVSHMVVDGLTAVLDMLKRGIIVYLLCLAMEAIILAVCKLMNVKIKYPYVLCHFSLGVLSFLAYI